MEDGKIVATSNFDMLEGARALEMGNARLDTGLLKLTKAELSFDSSKGQPLSAVVSTMNKLFISYMSWLEGSSLLVTILSCRYVLDFLQSYRRCRQVKLSSFIEPRLHPEGYAITKDTNSQLVNKVLRAFVIGVSKLISFSLSVATSVLYDEEDLVTRTMDFDFLDQVSSQVASAEIEEAELWLQQQDELRNDKDYDVAVKQLKLIKALLRLEDVLRRDVQLFEETSSWGIPNKDETVLLIQTLKAQKYGASPDSAFSRFVQLDCANKHLPSQNFVGVQDKTYDGLQDLVNSVDDIVQKFTQVKNVGQLQTYLKYNVGFHMAANANALTRGVFQLFFIRDDRSIAGLAENVGSITTRLMENMSLCGNTIMDPTQWNIQNKNNAEGTKAECLNKMAELLNDLEAASIHKLGAFGNNRCRQRQINNKSIVLWDSLHFNAETIETELFDLGIGDRLSPEFNDQPAFGISSYVYLEKLDTMIEVALSGFEQDLYKLHEAPMMFWFISELYSQAHQLITERMLRINEGKLLTTQNFPKKIKSTKAGPKKEALKIEYSRLKDQFAPIAASNVIYLDKYLSLTQLALFHATKGISTAINIMSVMCDSSEKKTYLASDELLYNLRMKPWSSCGVPEVPTYESYLRAHFQITSLNTSPITDRALKLQKHIVTAKQQLIEAERHCEEICHNLKSEGVLRERLYIDGHCEVSAWYGDLRKTCVVYTAQLSRLESDTEYDYRISRVKGLLPYFPIYKLEKNKALLSR